ncbi:MAG: universal stress protein [Cryobacterium sp.]
MYENTVVGWDGSAPAQAAVDWAVRRAQGRSRAVRIVRVVDDVARDADDLDTRWAVAVATHALAEVSARLRVDHPEIDLTTAVAVGEPAEVLNGYADGEALIVVGTEHGHIDEHWSGSRLGARLAAAASGPVAVIPVPDTRRRSGVIAGIGGPDEPKSIALFAAELAHLLGEELHLVHASPENPAGSESALDTTTEAAFDRALASIAHAFPAVVVHGHVEPASPASALLRRARDASLIVVGARRPGVARRLFLGSVSHTLVSNAPCPTIVMPKRAKGAM